MALLRDHTIPQATVDGCVAASRAFFALPRARKDEWKLPSGYPPRSDARITSPRGWGYEVQAEHGEQMINEWIMVRDSLTPASELDDEYYTCPEGAEFHSPERKHPYQQRWPHEVPTLREATGAYHRALQPFVSTMYEMTALALALPGDFFTSRARRSPIWPVKIAHYPAHAPPPPRDQQRIAPHYDRTLFSMITTSDVHEQTLGSGLQVRTAPAAVSARRASARRHVAQMPSPRVRSCADTRERAERRRCRRPRDGRRRLA